MAEYKYDGLHRRVWKEITNSGTGIVNRSNDINGDGTEDADGIQAGDRVEQYYYAGWSIVEIRDNNATPRTLGQFTWRTEYIDAGVAYDRNTDFSFGTPDNECLDSGGSHRYMMHYDANFRTVALTNESGAVVERYRYTAYGEPTITLGGSTQAGNVLTTSSVGNPFMHQGLFRDEENAKYQNRLRHHIARLGRFMERDPFSYVDGITLYERSLGSPLIHTDPFGLDVVVPRRIWEHIDRGEDETRRTGNETGGPVVKTPAGTPSAREDVVTNPDGTEDAGPTHVNIDDSTNPGEELRGTWHTHGPTGNNVSGEDIATLAEMVEDGSVTPPGLVVGYVRPVDGDTYVATVDTDNDGIDKAKKCATRGRPAIVEPIPKHT